MLDTIIYYIGPCGLVLFPALAVAFVATVIQEIRDRRRGGNHR